MVSIIISVLIAWFSAQVLLKTVIESVKNGRFSPEAAFQLGGMPSGHSALVGALCSAIAKTQGVDSSSFAITAVFSLLVVYDALVTRRILRAQGEVLQSLSKKRFKKVMGHSLIEVMIGLLIGALIAWVLV